MTITVPHWDPPWQPACDPSFVRVSGSHLRDGHCAEQVAKKARPEVRPADRGDYMPAIKGTFPLGLARDAAIRLLQAPPAGDAAAAIAGAVDQAASASGEPWPDEAHRAARDAVTGYVQVLRRLQSTSELPQSPVFADVVLLEDDGTMPVEMFTWAVHLIAEDGATRETHILRWQNAPAVRMSEAAVAAAAHTLAAGRLVEPKPKKQWSDPYQERPIQPPVAATKVRVRVIGMLDATDDLRFDGDPIAAAALFARKVPAALGPLAGGRFLPGSRCATCALRQACPEVDRMPGLLGIAGYSESTRSVTPSDLWAHRACPRQLHLRSLGLPQTNTGKHPNALRGQQIHEWLQTAHDRGVPCTAGDLPEPAAGDHEARGISTLLGWSYDDYVTNRRYLLGHLEHCPVPVALDGRVTSEVSMTAWDTDANVVISTRADLAYAASSGGQVLRETKTVDFSRVPDDDMDLLRHFPQAAINVCLLADGMRVVDGALSDAPSIVEVELLSATLHHLARFDVTDPLVVLEARTALSERVDTWLFDTEHPVGDDPPCRSCPVQRYCDTGRTLAATIDGTLAGLAETDLEWRNPSAAALYTSLGVAFDDDEEFPF